MNTLLKLIFLYLPASFAYYTLIYSILILFGVVNNPQSFDQNNYTEIGTVDGITYHELKK